MFHISQIKEGSNILHLLLEGSLNKTHAAALEAVLDEALEKGFTRFVLHCKELRYPDDEGVRFLLKMKIAGARLMDLPLLSRQKQRGAYIISPYRPPPQPRCSFKPILRDFRPC